MNKSCDLRGPNQTEHSFGRLFAFNFSFSSVGFLGVFLGFFFWGGVGFFLTAAGTQRAAMIKLFFPWKCFNVFFKKKKTSESFQSSAGAFQHCSRFTAPAAEAGIWKLCLKKNKKTIIFCLFLLFFFTKFFAVGKQRNVSQSNWWHFSLLDHLCDSLGRE